MMSALAQWFGISAVVVAATACSGGDGSAERVAASDAWARPTPAGTATGAVYLILRAENDDALVAISVDPSVATMAMAHETATNDGIMSMDLVEGIALPSGDDIRFEPGGHHVMLEGLAAPLVAGDTFQLTLDFEHADDVIVEVAVRDEAP